MFPVATNPLQLAPTSTGDSERGCVSYSLDGKEASVVNVSIENSTHVLWITSSTDRTTTPLDLFQLKCIEIGNGPKDSTKIKKLLNGSKVSPSQLLSLYFGDWPWKACHFCCLKSSTAEQWLEKLNTYINPSAAAPALEDSHTSIDAWLYRVYMRLKQVYGEDLHVLHVLRIFSKLRLWRGFQLLRKLQRLDSSLCGISLHNPPFSTIKSLYFSYISTKRQDIREIYQRYTNLQFTSLPHKVPPTERPNTPSGRRKASIGIIGFKHKPQNKRRPQQLSSIQLNPSVTMSVSSFAEFLAMIQGRDHVQTREAAAIIAKYDTFAEHSHIKDISLKGFTHYMLSQETAPPPHLKSEITEKMGHPLSDYLIASSHNTYLTGHQLHGESSISMYIKVLHSGCRCVELDCWDGECGEPIIYHGHTLTSKIKFKAVVEAIGIHAFAVSPYPLILSIENHCSLQQQKKMASYMKDVFGGMLLTAEREVGERLPSPEALKHKILIKHRKIRLQSDYGTRAGAVSSKSKNLPGNLDFKTTSLPSSPNSSPLIFSSYSSCPNTPDTHVRFHIPMRPVSSLGDHDQQQTPLDTETSAVIDEGFLHMSTIHEEDRAQSTSLRGQKEEEFFTPVGVVRSGGDKAACAIHSSVSRKNAISVSELSKSASAGMTGISTKRGRAGDKTPEVAQNLSLSSVGDSSSTADWKESLLQLLYKPKSRRMSVANYQNTGLPLQDNHEALRESQQSLPKTVGKSANYTTPDSTAAANLPNSDPVFPTETPNPPPSTEEQVFYRNQQPNSDTILYVQPPANKNTAQPSLETPTFRRRSNPLPEEYQMLFSDPIHETEHQFSTQISKQKRFRSATLDRPLSLRKQNLLRTVLETNSSPSSVGNRPLSRSNSSSPEDSSSGESSDTARDTAELSFDSKDIARELSDMVVYTETIKFTGFKGQEQKVSEMYSFSENAAKKAMKKSSNELVNFNVDHLSRVYPSATRINSSNFNPAYYWMHGCQMVALNYQTNDTPMQHNMALFRQNGGCGYIPKPLNWKERAEEALSGCQSISQQTQLTLTVISGQYLVSSASLLPTVEMEVLGLQSDACKAKFQARSHSDDCTLWDGAAMLSTNIAVLAFVAIKFTVYTDKSLGPLHCHTVPLTSIQNGYQHVYFNNSATYDFMQPPSSLFIHVKLKGNDVVERREELEEVLFVELAVEETPSSSFVTHTSAEPVTCEELIVWIIKKAKLERTPLDYCLYCNDQVVEPSSLVKVGTQGLKLKDAPYQQLNLLAMVPIDYCDLSGVRHDPITLFADVTTTAKDLLSASVARLGSDLEKLYPHLKDCEDEEMIQDHFCMVLASSKDNILTRFGVLKSDAAVLEVFSSSDSHFCLLLHTNQQHHKLEGSSPALNAESSHTFPQHQFFSPKGTLFPSVTIDRTLPRSDHTLHRHGDGDGGCNYVDAGSIEPCLSTEVTTRCMSPELTVQHVSPKLQKSTVVQNVSPEVALGHRVIARRVSVQHDANPWRAQESVINSPMFEEQLQQAVTERDKRIRSARHERKYKSTHSEHEKPSYRERHSHTIQGHPKNSASARASRPKKRWLKKFGLSRSVELLSGDTAGDNHEEGTKRADFRPAAGHDADKETSPVLKPKSKKKWSFRSKPSRKKALERSHSFQSPQKKSKLVTKFWSPRGSGP